MTAQTKPKVTVAQFVAASTKASGVPVKVKDKAVLAKIARLIRP